MAWPQPERTLQRRLGRDRPDRTAERNARSALIARDRAARSVEQQADETVAGSMDGARWIRGKRSYEISEVGVKLAERRVEEQDLLAELPRPRAGPGGRPERSRRSRNQRTQALVAHTIARLQFWNNLGILHQRPRQWETHSQ